MLLAAALMCVIISACGGGDGGNSTTTTTGEQAGADAQADNAESQTENPYYLPDLPDVEFGGYNFRFLNTEQEAVSWNLTMLESEELNGDVFDDAVYSRNRLIEEKYNITLTETLVNGTGELLTRARRSIQGGSDDWDMIMLSHGDSFTAAQTGLLTEVRDIPNINLEKGYWDQSFERDYSLQNKLFMLAGDFSFTHYSATMVIFFNKKLTADYGLGNPYALVKDGKWTFDQFHSFAKQTVTDLNGDGKMDKDDRYGYMSLTFLLYPAFMTGANEPYILKDSTDTPYLNIGSERFIQAYHKMIGIMHDGDLLYDADLSGRNHRDQDVMFPGNQTLFWTELMNWSKILRDMDADFGILPHPKYDEAQENYRCMVAGSIYMTVPVTSLDLDRTGIILEALCAESRKSVIPVYYDTVLKTKISRDNESGEMLDIIFAARSYDLADSAWGGQVYGPFNTLARNNDGDVASFLDRNEGRIATAIENTLAKIAENN